MNKYYNIFLVLIAVSTGVLQGAKRKAKPVKSPSYLRTKKSFGLVRLEPGNWVIAGGKITSKVGESDPLMNAVIVLMSLNESKS